MVDMGNCQATDAAAVVIQHPGGRVERLYWPTPASEVMRSNPGHYVALITLCRLSQDPPQYEHGAASTAAAAGGASAGASTGEGVRFTRVRLLRPKDTLVLGQVYRLVTSQEVIKGLRARKQEKMRVQMELLKKQRQQQQQHHDRQQYERWKAACSDQGSDSSTGGTLQDADKDSQAARQDRSSRHRAAQPGRPRQWRPSLQSISEAAS